MTGFAWVRKIIKKNASLSGQQVPMLTREGRMSYTVSIKEKTKTGTKLDETTLTQLREIEESDTEMGRGLRELSQYRIDNIEFLFGAVSAYQALKRMHDSDKLSSSLKF